MITKAEITEKHIDTTVLYGLLIATENQTLRFEGLTAIRSEVEELSSRLLNTDITTEHLKDIIRDFIVEKAYDTITANSI
ncbi:MAG: hypothetical protein IJO68_04965 [Clostridia bacterium]|nr:hypothetical protein [Clostridia bacterium]